MTYCALNATEPNTTAVAVRFDVKHCDPNERLWWVFLLCSILTLIGGLLLVLLGKFVAYLHKKVSQRSSNQMKKVGDTNRLKDNKTAANGGPEKQDDIGCITAAKDWAGELISGQTNSGRILVS